MAEEGEEGNIMVYRSEGHTGTYRYLRYDIGAGESCAIQDYGALLTVADMIHDGEGFDFPSNFLLGQWLVWMGPLEREANRRLVMVTYGTFTKDDILDVGGKIVRSLLRSYEHGPVSVEEIGSDGHGTPMTGVDVGDVLLRGEAVFLSCILRLAD